MDLLWLDLETTGLSARGCNVLEIYIAKATLENPFEAKEVYHRVLWFHLNRYHREGLIDPFVIEMHTKNGLWAECDSEDNPLGDEVDEELCRMFPDILPVSDRPVLAGNSIHFDHAFIAEHFPQFNKRLSHRHYDVSSVGLYARSLGMGKLPKAEAHRAKDDVLESIASAKAMEKFFEGYKGK